MENENIIIVFITSNYNTKNIEKIKRTRAQALHLLYFIITITHFALWIAKMTAMDSSLLCVSFRGKFKYSQ